MVHAPAQHFLRIFKHQAMMGGIVGEVMKLVGIALQIEKQWRQAGKMDVFVALVPEQAGAALIGRQAQRPAAVKPWKIAKIERRMCVRAPVLNIHAMTERQQRGTITGGRNRKTKPFQNGRHDIDILGEGIHGVLSSCAPRGAVFASG